METQTEIHVGHLVKDLMRQKKMKLNALVPFIHTNKTNITKLLQKPDWRISEVVGASQCLKVDIFKYFNLADDNAGGITPVGQILNFQNQVNDCKQKLQEEKERRLQSEELNKLYREKVRAMEMELASLRNK